MNLLKKLRNEKLVFWLLISLVVFIPLYPKFPLVNIGGTYVAIRLEDIFFLIVSVIWFINILPRLKQLIAEPIYRLFIIFWLIGGLSLFSGFFITHTLYPHLGFLHWFRRIEYMMFFVMAATTFKSFEQVKLLLKIFIPVTVLIVLYGFGQELFKFPVISTTNREFSKGQILFLSPDARVNSTFAGHYDLAFYLNFVLVMLSSMFFVYKKLSARIVMIFTGLGSFILLGMTASRVSFVATLGALALSFLMNNKKLLLAFLFFAAIAIVGLVPDLRHRLVATVTVNLMGGGGPKYELPEGVAPPNLNKLSESSKSALFMVDVIKVGSEGAKITQVPSDVAPGEPLNVTELGVFRSFEIRFNVEWPRALNAFYKNPLLGTGYSSLTIATDNDFLRSLGEVGILGTLALGLIFIVIAKSQLAFIFNSTGIQRAFMVGVFCVLLSMIATGVFFDVLEASKIATLLWFLLGVSWAIIKGKNENS